MTDDSTIHGLAVGVHGRTLGDQLTVAASIGATVLTVNDVGPFEPGPGWVQVNGTVYPYSDCDDDANTLTLTTALTAAAAVDDRVDLYDQANGQVAVTYDAVVINLDGFEDPGAIEATVSDQLAHALQQEMVDGNGVSVTLERAGSELEVTGILGRSFTLASLQYLQGGMTTRTGEDQAGVEVIGAGYGTPGLHIHGNAGLEQMSVTADNAGGVIKFWTGVTGEDGPGYINPFLDGSGDIVLAIASPPSATIASILQLIAGAHGYVEVVSAAQFDAVATFKNTVNVIGGDIGNSAGRIYTGPTAPSGTSTGDIAATGRLWTLGANTTSVAANVNMGTGGALNKVTSLSRYKVEQEPLSVSAVRGILNLTPKTWYDRGEVEENGGTEGLRRIPGLIAEDVQEHVPELALYDADGELEGVAYDRVAAYLIPHVRALNEENAELRARVETLERLVNDLLETKGDV